MLAAEANNCFFQRPKRAVAIRRDGDDFVVSLMPNDLVIFRNESADALRKLCKGLRWAVVSDTAIASIDLDHSTWVLSSTHHDMEDRVESAAGRRATPT